MNDPASFAKSNHNTVRDARNFLSKHKNAFKFQPSEDILEIGCANGRVTSEVLFPFVKDHLNTLLAADKSQDAVDEANKIYGNEKIRFEQMDIEGDNFELKYKERFHHIFTFYLIDVLKIPERWSKNIFGMLKPKGQLFGSVLLYPHPYPSVTIDQRNDKNSPWEKYIQDCPDVQTDYGPEPVKTITEILNKAGFNVDVMETHSLVSTLSIEDYNRAMFSLNNFIKYIPEELIEEYKKDFFRRIEEKARQNGDGTCSYDKYVLTFVATKP